MVALGGARDHCVDAPHQVLGAAAAHGDRRDHRRAKLFRQLDEIDVDAAPAGDVDHVEHEHQRAADLLELDHQAQGDAQIGGVGDAKQQIGRRLAGEPAEHDVARDLFVGAAPAQRIGSGQIDQIDAMARRASG